MLVHGIYTFTYFITSQWGKKRMNLLWFLLVQLTVMVEKLPGPFVCKSLR